ncbi:MAG: acetyl-CoA C-acetyltransferase [Pseudomonadota bacterium]
MREVWIIDAARTPRGIGKPGKGALCEIHPQRMLSAVLDALATRCNLNTADIDDVVIGCGAQYQKQGNCIAKMAALDAGYDITVPGVSIERFCGSGLSAVNIGVMGVASGMQDLVVAGGVESMSQTPMNLEMMDSGNLHLRQKYPQVHQGLAGDMLATLNDISREDVDNLALESQRRAQHAIENAYFENSLIPVCGDDGNVALAVDEYPRPSTTRTSLAALEPAFARFCEAPLDDKGLSFASMMRETWPQVTINHVHHAGNSSGIVDGAAAVALASKDYAQKNGLLPRAKVLIATTAADCPMLMADAPTPATRKALAKTGMSIDDIDLIEINEAFAAVPIKFMRDFDLDDTRVNVNGGAIALGHPIGATGAILLGTLLDELERRDLETGLVTLCAAGGMAPATIIQRCG